MPSPPAMITARISVDCGAMKSLSRTMSTTRPVPSTNGSWRIDFSCMISSNRAGVVSTGAVTTWGLGMSALMRRRSEAGTSMLSPASRPRRTSPSVKMAIRCWSASTIRAMLMRPARLMVSITSRSGVVSVTNRRAKPD